MLRGRLAKRDNSICAFCRHGISLQRTTTTSHNRHFSVTPSCASFNTIPLRGMVPLIGSRDASTPSKDPDSSTTNNGSTAFPITVRRTLAKGGLTPLEKRTRDRILQKQEKKAKEKENPRPDIGVVDYRVKARYVWDAERQAGLEKLAKKDALSSKPTSSMLPPDYPSVPPPIRFIGSGKPIGSPSREPRPLEELPGSTTEFRKAAGEHSIQKRQIPPREYNPLDRTRPMPSSYNLLDRNNSMPLSYSLLDRTRPMPSSSLQPTESAINPTPPKADVAGANHTENSSNGSGAARDWLQLTRKTPPKPIMTEGFWSAGAERLNDASLRRTTFIHEFTPRRDEASRNLRGNAAAKPRPKPLDSPEAPKTTKKNTDEGFWPTTLNPDAASKSTTITTNEDFWNLAQSNEKKPQPKPKFNNKPSGRSPAQQGNITQVSPDPYSAWSNTPANSLRGKPSGHSPVQSWGAPETATWANRDYDKSRRREPFDRGGKGDSKKSKRSQGGSRYHEDEDDEDHYDRYQEKRRQKELRKAQREAERTEPIPISLPELISVTAFAHALKIKPEDFLVQLGELGFEGVTLDSLMAGETAALVAQEYGYEPTVEAGDSQDLKPRPPPEDPSTVPSRPPVVTIMGHVDHGKTTILDYLRKSSVAAQEHGGITQHIGAFSVKLSSGKPITFLDTPGHAAFLTMRQRGANVTDIVVLVVAADDSVKPQTLEALKHARAAKVPIIVAINKVDKEGARIDAVKHDLATAGVEIEDFGGDVQVVCVSGKTGQGMDDLEENILTLSEILDHRAEPDGPAEGWILESSLKPTGKVATVLVKRGTLRPGDYIAAGLTWAKIRHLRNEAGQEIDEAPPGTPVEILGWKDLPAAGDQVIQSPDEDKAKTAVAYREGLRDREKDAAEYEAISESRKAYQEKRALEKAEKALVKNKKRSHGEGGTGTGVVDVQPEEENGTKIVNFVVKGDVHGSVEAVCAAIQEIGSHEVRPRVLKSATGPVTQSDVEHAAIAKAMIVNFATTTPGHVKSLAEHEGVRILDHNIIYHLVDDVKSLLSGYLAPDISTRVLGEAEVLQVFPINIRGRVFKNVAGCRVRNGVVSKGDLYRVVRGGETVFEGKLETLKNVKKDVMEMRKGTECGMGFEEFQDLRQGDQIQAYEEVTTTRNL